MTADVDRDAHEVARLVSAVRTALDGPLAGHGFAPGQGGSDPDRVQVVFCCGEDDFFARHPGVLPRGSRTGPWGCVDLMVDLDRGPSPRVVDVRLETEGLLALLARSRDGAAVDEARQLPDLPLDAALARLPRLVLLALDVPGLPTRG